MADGSKVLSYSVRLPVVGHYLRQLALMLALLALVPCLVALLFEDFAFALRSGVAVALLLAVGLPGLRAPEPGHIQTNEAMVVVSLAFLLAPLVMTFPMAASGLPVVDAYFEAVSGVSTTGLSTAGPPELRSPVFLFARSWMQWFGGLGIAVLSVALLMAPHAAARRFVEPPQGESLATTARTQARQILLVYAGLTAIGMLALWLVSGDPFRSLLLILSAVSTGGFAPEASSLAALPGAASWIVTGFTLLGAAPLLLYFYAWRRGPGVLLADPEVRALGVAVVLISTLMAGTLFFSGGMDAGSALRHGVQMGVAAQTTSGFSSVTVTGLPPVALLLLMGAMLVGGGVGSSAGGIKLLRLLVMLRLLQVFFRATAMPPHAVATPTLSGRALEREDIEPVLLLLVLFFGAAAVSWLAFVAWGYPPLESLFEVISALGTVGLSTGIARPELEPALKLVLCADMLLGRLELIALLVLLYPRTWIGKRT